MHAALAWLVGWLAGPNILLLSSRVVLCLGELDITGFLVNAELEGGMLLFSLLEISCL